MNPSSNNEFVSVKNVSKSFGSTNVVRNVSLDIHRGEFISLLGPSGSGKTTTLMMIAGFEKPDRGTISLEGQVLDNVPPYKRNLGFVFQSYALFPHMTIARNVAYPLAMRKLPKSEIDKAVAESLMMVDLPIAEYGDRMPRSLSGGQQQRVALARAIVFKPRVMLLDEPLGALDRRLRETMLDEFRNLHRKLGTTMIYVTHDQEEALTMSDRVAVFADGRIQQIGTPNVLYQAPSNEFVATFLGDSNRLTVARSGDVEAWRAGDGTILPGRAVGDAMGESIVLVVRPENVQLADPSASLLVGRVSDLMYVGDHVRVTISTPNGPVVSKQYGSGTRRIPGLGETVGLTWNVDDAVVVPVGSSK